MKIDRIEEENSDMYLDDDLYYFEDATQEFFDTNSSIFKKLHRLEICKKTGNCSYCPPHGFENYRKQSKADKYKNHR